MWKTRVKIRADIAACVDTRKVTRIVVDNWRNETTNMDNSDGDTDINFTNVELAEFGVYTKISLANSICKTCRKWTIDDFMKCSDNNLITS